MRQALDHRKVLQPSGDYSFCDDDCTEPDAARIEMRHAAARRTNWDAARCRTPHGLGRSMLPDAARCVLMDGGVAAELWEER